MKGYRFPTALAVIGTLVLMASCCASAVFGTEPSPEETRALAAIKGAFTPATRGPLISCWNIQWNENALNSGWNLRQQVEWIKAGHPYHITIYVPLTSQGANNPTKWTNFKTMFAAELAYINANKLPVTVRWHNWLNEMIDGVRPPYPDSPLVHYLKSDGTLEDQAILDPFAPLSSWTATGVGLSTSYWIQQLAAECPDVPSWYWLENNEASMGAEGQYTTLLSGPKDAWGYKPRAWRSNLNTISVRAADYAASHTTAQLHIDLPRKWREKRETMEAAILANAPATMQGKIYFGGYGDLGTLGESGMLGQTYSYLNPAVDWNFMRWDVAVHSFTDPSERCYDDGSGSPWNWHDWVRGPHVLQHNFVPLLREQRANKSPYHDDMSWWMSPSRCRAAAVDHGGYVLPERAKGFARACLWSSRPDVFRFFASSQEKLTDQWFTSASDPVEVQSLTTGDYFNAAMSTVDEVWLSQTLLKFWREGEPVVNPDPHFCKWVLPSDVNDNRSLTLYSTVDAPRYVGGVDTWNQQDGKVELKVFAQAYRINDPAFGPQTLVFAWSPRQVRTNVGIQVPGVGTVMFDTVDQDGEWRLSSGGMAIH